MQITRDQINSRSRGFRRFIATSDTGGSFEIPVQEAIDGGVFAFGRVTESVVRVVQTGTVRRMDGQVRVRIEFGQDTGDQAGTIDFGVGHHTGGWAPVEAF